MVAIVSGNGLGLLLGSAGVLGQRGVIGDAAHGGKGEGAYLNVATGNLVLQGRDDYLAARGLDVGVVRTYNAQGLLTDDNGDNWRLGLVKRVANLTGTLNTAGSSLTRIEGDGSEAVYTYDAARNLYLSTAGADAHDTLSYNSQTSKWTWTDGTTRTAETYDWAAGGRLASMTDASGMTQTYYYDAAGMLSRVTTASGENTYFDYAGTNLTQVRVVSGTTTVTRVRYEYDTANRLSAVITDLSPTDNSIADGATYVTRYTYDGSSTRVASMEQSDGTRLSFAYVQVGTAWRVAEMIDGEGRLTRLDYAADGTSTTVTDPLDYQTVYTYDAQGQLTGMTGPLRNGNAINGVTQQTRYVYDTQGNVRQMIDGRGNAIDMEYDANGNQTLQRDAAGNTVRRSYGSQNQLLTETVYLVPDPDGNGAGQPAQGLTTRYAYDTRNRLRFIISAEGRVTEYRYDGYGNRTAVIQYNGGKYDTSALAESAAPTEAQLTTWVGGADKIRTMRTNYSYDGRGLLYTATAFAKVDALGNGIADGTHSTVTYVHDQHGLLLKTVDANSGITLFTYDGLGRQLSTTNQLNQVTLTSYDAASHSVTVRLANGLATTSVYNGAGELTGVTQADPNATPLGQTRYHRDAAGRLRMVEDPTGRRSFMLYDAAGRNVADIDADGSLVEYVHNANGQVTQTIRYANAVNTALLTDANGNPAEVALAALRVPDAQADRTSWNSYDAAGRLVKSVDAQGYVTQIDYDGAGRAVRTVRYANAINTSGLSSAPAPGVIAPPSSADDRVTRAFYDGDGKLQAELDAEGYLTTHRYDAAGRLVETVAYATATDPAHRATGNLAQLQPVAGADDIRQYRLYDGKGQLTGAIDGEGYLTEYVYDRNGNLTQKVRYATAVAYIDGAAVANLRPQASADDQATTYIYTKLNQLWKETAADGTVNQHVYDAVGNLVSSTLAISTTDARVHQKRYDLQGRVIAELSAEGATKLNTSMTQAAIDAIWDQYAVKYHYDAAGRRIGMTDQNGNRSLYFYDGDGRLAATVNALGEVETRSYSTHNELVATRRYGTRLAGSVLAGLTGGTFESSLAGILAALADNTADSTRGFAYDTRGLLVTQYDELGGVTTTDYDAFGNVTARAEQIDIGEFLRHTYRYDRRGLQTQASWDPNGIDAREVTRYDAFGRATEHTDANGHSRQTTYDRLGRTVVVEDARGGRTGTSYDAFDRVLTQTDAQGNITRYTYNTQQRSMTVTTPEGITKTVVYNRHGQEYQITDGNGNATTFAYTANGDLYTVTDGAGKVVTHTYDRARNLVTTLDANNVTTAFQYDAANRVLIRTVDPNGLRLVTEYGYDAKGQVLRVTDPNGIVTLTEYDAKGQARRITVDPTGERQVTELRYDGRGKTVQVTDPEGRVTRYKYDALGRRTHQFIDPDGMNLETRFIHDDVGNVTARIDANGHVTRFAYDANGRMTHEVDGAGGVTEYRHDANGRVVQAIRHANPISLAGLGTAIGTADIDARLIPDAARDNSLTNIYDRDGRLVFTVDGNGAVTRRTYDGNGNVVRSISYATPIPTATAPTVAAVQAAVDAVADATHDVLTIRAYDVRNRVSAQVDGKGAVQTFEYDANGNVVYQRAYATGIDVGLLGANPTAADIKARVTAADARDQQARMVYDAANRLVASATAQSVNGMGHMQWSVVRQTYDKNGNVVSRTAHANFLSSASFPANPTQANVQAWINSVSVNNTRDQAMRMVYDGANRLQAMATAQGVDSSGVLQWAIVRQTYDKNGNIVSRTAHATFLSSAGLPLNPTQASIKDWIGSVAQDGARDRTERLAYDAANRLQYSIDALNVVTERGYDGLGNVVKTVTYAEPVSLAGTPDVQTIGGALHASTQDRVERTVYDAANRAAYDVDALGHVTERQYDAAGNVIAVVRRATSVALAALPDQLSATQMQEFVVAAADDRLERRVIDAAGRLRYSIDAAGYVKRNDYDAMGRILRTTQYAHAVTVGAINVTEQALASALQADPAGDRTQTFVYDAQGNLVRSSDALGAQESFTYDALGRKLSYTNKKGATWDYQYDAAGRLTGETAPEVETSTLTPYVDNEGKQRYRAQTSLVRAQAQISYDAFGNVSARIEAVNTPQLRATSYTYDLTGRQVGTTIRGASNVLLTTTVTYDALGNAVMNVDVGNNRSYKAYDRAGRIAYEIDAKGFVTGYDRDAFGAVTALTRYASALSGLGNRAPSLTEVEAGLTLSAADRTIHTHYDALGRAVKVVEPQAYGFDQHSLLADDHITAGKATATRYNAFGDVIGQSVYGENAQGVRVTEAADTRFYVNRRGERIAQVTAVDNQGASHLGYLTTMEYDAAGNLTRQVEYANSIASWSDTAYGQPAAKPDEDRDTRFAYDLNNRKIAETRVHISFSQDASGVAVQGDATTTYGYDAVGNLVRTTDALGHTAYTYYDALGRVVAVAAHSAEARSQVAALYAALFDREPDIEGLANWVQVSNDGASLGELAAAMLVSNEAQARYPGSMDNATFVTRIYNNALDRDPDAQGLAYWTNALNTQSRGQVVADIVRAALEYSGDDATARASQATFNGKIAANLNTILAPAAQVARLYAALHDGAPAPARLDAWVRALRQGATPAALADTMLADPAFHALFPPGLTNTEFVTKLYNVAQGRQPDAGGLAHWVGQLDASTSRGTVVAGILDILVNGTATDALSVASRKVFNDKVVANLNRIAADLGGLAPLTEFKLDVHGNVVQRTDYALGAAVTNAYAYAPVLSNPADRTTSTIYDRSGHATETVDAEGNAAYAAYDDFGRVVRQWQTVTDSNGVSATAFKEMRYDALGQLIEVIEPDAGGAVVRRGTAYNAFGEATGRSVNGSAYEYADYDNAGRVWRTNAGDGVDKVLLHDIEGHVTAEIRSASASLRGLAAPEQAATLGNLLRSETRYDLMGRVIEQTGPAHVQTQTANSIQSAFVSASIASRSEYVVTNNGDNEVGRWRGTNEVNLSWMSLAEWGSGDVKVQLDYESNPVPDPSGAMTELLPAQAASYTRIFSAGQAENGVTLTWQGLASGLDSSPSVDNIKRIQVWKKDLSGEWKQIINQTQQGIFGSYVRIETPADPNVTVTLQYRQTGATSWTDAASLPNFGDALIFDTTVLAEGTYEYRVMHRGLGEAVASVQDSGTLTVASQQVPRLRTQVTQLYVLIFNRGPSIGDLDYWTDLMRGGMTAADVAQSFLDSEEGRTLYPGGTANEIVDGIYRNALGRSSLPLEAFTWIQQLNSQPNKGQILVALANDIASYQGGDPARRTATALFKNKVDAALAYAVEMSGNDSVVAKAVTNLVSESSTTAAINYARSSVETTQRRTHIAQLYVALLNRALDRPGLDYWIGRLNQGASVEDIGNEMLASFEATGEPLRLAELDDAGFITHLYRTVMNRAPDAAGLAHWTAKLAGSATTAPASRGKVAAEIANAVASYKGFSASNLAEQKLFNNKTTIGLSYAINLGGNDLTVARALIAAVNGAPSAIQAADAAQAATASAAQVAEGAASASQAAAAAMPLEQRRMQIAQLYVALLDRAPEHDGLKFYIDSGASITQIANQILASGEASNPALYPSGQSDAQFVTRVFELVLGRGPDPDGLAYWTHRLAGTPTAPAATRGEVVHDIINGFLEYPGTDALEKSRQDLFNNKVAVALTFALDLKGNDIAVARSILDMVTATDTSAAVIAAINAAAAVAAAAAAALAGNSGAAATGVGAIPGAVSTAASSALAAAGAMTTATNTPTAVIRLQIGQLYTAIMDREPDLAGLNDWVAFMQSGKTMAEVAHEMFKAQETKDPALYPDSLSNTDFVARVYSLVLTRQSSVAEQQDWARLFDQGKTRGDVLVAILNGFLNYSGTDVQELAHKADFIERVKGHLAIVAAAAQAAAEAAATEAGSAPGNAAAARDAANEAADLALGLVSPANTAAQAETIAMTAANDTPTAVIRLQIGQLYTAIMDREPDLAGLNDWVAFMQSGKTMAEVAHEMFKAQETKDPALYPDSLSNTDFVARVYSLVLTRQSSVAEQQDWARLFDQGKTRGDVLVAILNGFLNYSGTDVQELSLKADLREKISENLDIVLGRADNAKVTAWDTYREKDGAKTRAETDLTTASTNAGTAVGQVRDAQAAVDRTAEPARQGQAYRALPSSIRTQVAQLFVAIVGRAPDLSATPYWGDKLLSGWTMADVAQNILSTSDEAKAWNRFPPYLTDQQFVERVYDWVLNRQADSGGVQHYMQFFSAGETRGQVLVRIMNGFLAYSGPDANEQRLKAEFIGRVSDAERVAAGYATTAIENKEAADLALGRANSNKSYWDGEVIRLDPIVSNARNDASAAWTAYTSAEQVLNATRTATNAADKSAIAARAVANKVAADVAAFNADQIADALEAAVAALNTANQAAQATSAAANAADKAYVAADAKADAMLAIEALSSMTPGAKRAMQVTQLYLALTDRAPEPDGVRFWASKLEEGKLLAEVATEMFASDEARALYPSGMSNATFIETLYNAVLDRPADTSGRALWLGRMEGPNPMTREEVVIGFVTSVMESANEDTVTFGNKLASALTDVHDAAQAAATNPDMASFIRTNAYEAKTEADSADAVAAAVAAATPGAQESRQAALLYAAVLDRLPDLAGFKTWLTFLQGAPTFEDAVAGAFESDEVKALYPASLGNDEFVTRFYQTALGRSPSAGELSSAMSDLSFRSRPQVVAGIIQAALAYDGTGIAERTSQKLLNHKVQVVLTHMAAATQADAVIARATATAAAAIAAAKPANAYVANAGELQQSITGTISNGQRTELKPVITQTVDRWGNVVRLTDARNPNWFTTYKYNANNQLIEESKPHPNGQPGGAVSQFYYDKLGRTVATRDARGFVNGVEYDANGNVARELQADAGVVEHTYNIFGDRTRIKQANGTLSGYSYDHMSRMTRTTSGTVDIHEGEDRSNTQGLGLSYYRYKETRELVETYRYDELGRRIVATNAAGETLVNTYDLRGNVIRTKDTFGVVTQSSYDAFNHKVSETNGNGHTMYWTVDAFGKLRSHTDLGGRQSTYVYDQAGRLTEQTAGAAGSDGLTSTAQRLVYHYEGNLLTRIEDTITRKVTTYAYDLAGNRVREKTVAIDPTTTQAGTFQDNHIGYDAQGRMIKVQDGRYQVDIEYDANGNRSRVRTAYFDDSGSNQPRVSDHWNVYDEMNRQTIVDGIEVNGQVVIGDKGHRIAYDKSGNRISDTYLDRTIVETDIPTGAYDENGNMVTRRGFTSQAGLTVESYRYDAAGRLTDIYRDGVNVDARRYDAAGRLVFSGPLPDQYTDAFAEQTLLQTLGQLGISREQRTTLYDANGRAKVQTTRDTEGRALSDVEYREYDGVGNIKQYRVHANGNIDQYDYVYGGDDAYKAKTVRVERVHGDHMGTRGRITNDYDANGHLIGVRDDTKPENNRQLVNDVAGVALFKAQNGERTHALVVNGEVLGSSSSGGTPDTFSTNHVPVTAASLTALPSTYTVRAGETLQSIAKAVWGDGSLWYLIAEANGLSGNVEVQANGTADLVEGQVITIPSRTNTVHNDFRTFKPYDPSSIVGDTTPNLPIPADKAGCGGFGQIVTLVVAAVLSYIAPWGTTIWADMAYAAVASTAGQATSIAVGEQDKFSWKQVATAALSAGATSGINIPPVGSEIANYVIRGAVNNVVNQSINIAVGLQDRFSWRAVAASAIAAPIANEIGTAVGKAVGNATGSAFVSDFAARLVGGVVSRGVSIAVHGGGKMQFATIAADAFCNALGSSIADGLGRGSQQESELTKFRQSEIAAMNADAREEASMGLGSGLNPYRSSAPGLRISERDYASWSDRIGEGIQYEADRQMTARQRDYLENSVAGPGGGIGSLRTLDNRALLNAAEQRMNPDYYRSSVRTMDWPELDMMGMPTGQMVQVPVPDSKLLPGEKIKGNVFFGGAGMDGPYIKDMVRAFDKQGITLTPADRNTWSNGTLVDLSLGVQATRFGKVPVLPLLDNFPQSGNQFNLLGYSYGSTVAAQVATNYARGGTTVDNLVLIGSPISNDFLKTLQTEPNIRNVVVVNLTDKGDPISAGMSNPSLIGAAPTLAKQMLNGTGQGHFYYEPSTPLVQVRRDALAEYLYQRGLR